MDKIKHALESSDKVIIIIGSVFKARDISNPFTFHERSSFITDAIENEFGKGAAERVFIRYVYDSPYNEEKWVSDVRNEIFCAIWDDLRRTREAGIKNGDEDTGYDATLSEVREMIENHDSHISLRGSKGDNDSFFQAFPDIETYLTFRDRAGINATAIRKKYFSNGAISEISSLVPKNVSAFLEKGLNTKEYQRLAQEYIYVKNEEERWASENGHRYGNTFVTTDAVVLCAGHILLVKRRSRLGEGLLALPGGYVNNDETIVDGMLRELREETGIKVSERVLRQNIRETSVFDAPDRSVRGRVITHAHSIRIALNPDSQDLPRLKGGSDALYAEWVPVANLARLREKLFEDHFHIASYFLRFESNDSR